MDIIDETDEIMQELEGQVKKPHLKEQKIKKHLVKDEKHTFDSGEYYKKKDIEKKMVDQAKIDTEKQAHMAEDSVHQSGEKKKKHIDIFAKQVRRNLARKLNSTLRSTLWKRSLKLTLR